MADHMRSELVVDALPMAVGRRRPAPGVSHHSDQGGQYVSLGFGQQCAEAGIAQSMGSTGVCFDNAVAETFFATLKKELVYRRAWPTRRELLGEIFEYIEVFYNRQRRHSTLGLLSPIEFEKDLSARRCQTLADTNNVNRKQLPCARILNPVHRSGGTPLRVPRSDRISLSPVVKQACGRRPRGPFLSSFGKHRAGDEEGAGTLAAGRALGHEHSRPRRPARTDATATASHARAHAPPRPVCPGVSHKQSPLLEAHEPAEAPRANFGDSAT